MLSVFLSPGPPPSAYVPVNAHWFMSHFVARIARVISTCALSNWKLVNQIQTLQQLTRERVVWNHHLSFSPSLWHSIHKIAYFFLVSFPNISRQLWLISFRRNAVTSAVRTLESWSTDIQFNLGLCHCAMFSWMTFLSPRPSPPGRMNGYQ